MRTRTLSFLIALGLTGAALAQTESFDAARFNPPKGWKHTESPGLLMFEETRTISGRVNSCQIFLFSSRPTSASPAENFQNDWNEKIVKAMGVSQKPTAQSYTSPDGWTLMVGGVDIAPKGVPIRVMLVTATGFGRAMSVIANTAGEALRPETQSFLTSLQFKANSNGATSTNQAAPQRTTPPPSGSLANYSYAVPAGWDRQETRDAIVLTSPVYQGGEVCKINLLATRPATRALPDDALNAFRQIFKQEPLTFYPFPWPKLARGVSPQGWEYFIVRKSVGGKDGDPGLVGATLLAAKIGDQVAIVVTTSKEPLVSNCFGELVNDLWPKFFYSLQFKNGKASGQEEAAIKQRLAGAWISATGSVGLRYEFHADGRYLGAGAAQQYSRINSNEVLRTTQAYFGDGTYSFDGNTIVMTGDDKRTSSKQFRLEQNSKDGGKTWADSLCLLDPGSTGEVCYQRTQ